MNYIYDNDDTYTKKCETDGCINEVFVGFSYRYCRTCSGIEPDELEKNFKVIPFYQQRLMQ